MDGFEIRSKLSALKERGADLVIKTCLFVIFLILEIYLIITYSFYVGERCMVGEHKYLTHPVFVLLGYFLYHRYRLSEHGLIGQTQTYGLINFEICGWIIELIVSVGLMHIESVPVGTVVSMHTEHIIAHRLEQFLCGGIISVPVIYCHSAAWCRHKRCGKGKLCIRGGSNAFLCIEIGEIDTLFCKLIYGWSKGFTVNVCIKGKALDTFCVDKDKVLACKHIGILIFLHLCIYVLNSLVIIELVKKLLAVWITEHHIKLGICTGNRIAHMICINTECGKNILSVPLFLQSWIIGAGHKGGCNAKKAQGKHKCCKTCKPAVLFFLILVGIALGLFLYQYIAYDNCRDRPQKRQIFYLHDVFCHRIHNAAKLWGSGKHGYGHEWSEVCIIYGVSGADNIQNYCEYQKKNKLSFGLFDKNSQRTDKQAHSYICQQGFYLVIFKFYCESSEDKAIYDCRQYKYQRQHIVTGIIMDNYTHFFAFIFHCPIFLLMIRFVPTLYIKIIILLLKYTIIIISDALKVKI